MAIMVGLMWWATFTTMVSMLMIPPSTSSQHGKTNCRQSHTKNTSTSHYSYEIIDNKLKLYPIPEGNASPERFWFRFTVENNDAFATGSYDSGVEGVNNMNTLPMENIPFENINSIGQQWIRRFALALSKETLGQVRGKFGGQVPIPGDNVSLNASDLLGQASAEQTALREELNKQLDEMLYAKLAEVDKAMVDNMDGIVAKTPLKIFVG